MPVLDVEDQDRSARDLSPPMVDVIDVRMRSSSDFRKQIRL